MMKKYLHIEEQLLKKSANASENVIETELKRIQEHLNECEFCNEVYKKYKTVFTELNIEINSEPTEHDKELAKRISFSLTDNRKKLLPENKSFVQIYEGNYEIITAKKKLSLANFVWYAINNPAKTTASVVLAGLICSLIFLYQGKIDKDLNPFFVRVNNLKIKVYNKQSDLLWERTAFGLPDTHSMNLMNWMLGSKKHVNIEDIDGDEINEVLVSGAHFATDDGFYKRDSVYCFNYNGKLRWTVGGEDPQNTKAPQWRNTGRFIRDFFTTKSGMKKQLFILGNDRNYAGTFISEINPESGKVISTLYHSGWFTARINADLDNDGFEEIILAGTSSYDKPSITVLKTDNIRGVMPDQYSKDKNYEKGTAFAYILIYTRNLHNFDPAFNSAIETDLKKLGENGFYINTPELASFVKNWNPTGIMYAFNSNLEINNISTSQKYIDKYNILHSKGLVKEKLDSAYFKMLKDSIQYWDGDKFVNHPVKNRYYMQKRKKPTNIEPQ